ncbi:MAG TPA: guanylate cyclase, partial [Reyranella sp.]|nr:guanylate cyclase [Reyranella sp.]
MTDDKVKRRLTTVLCADVHGYSRLMEADEAATLATLRRYRTAMAGLVERHDGRIVN